MLSSSSVTFGLVANCVFHLYASHRQSPGSTRSVGLPPTTLSVMSHTPTAPAQGAGHAASPLPGRVSASFSIKRGRMTSLDGDEPGSSLKRRAGGGTPISMGMSHTPSHYAHQALDGTRACFSRPRAPQSAFTPVLVRHSPCMCHDWWQVDARQQAHRRRSGTRTR